MHKLIPGSAKREYGVHYGVHWQNTQSKERIHKAKIHNAKKGYTVATVANSSTTETYTGMTGGPFRKRHYGHDHDMKEENEDEPGTTLSRHVHKLRKAGTSFTIKWDLLEEGLAGYNPTSGQCRLCLLEKFHIMFTPGVATLNRRREVFSSCRHRRKLTLMPQKAKT